MQAALLLFIYLATRNPGLLSLGSLLGFVCIFGERHGPDCELPARKTLVLAADGECGWFLPWELSLPECRRPSFSFPW